VALIGAGYADFPLIAFHLQKSAVIPQNQIPLLYALAMGVDAIAALICGKLFDTKGISVLAIAALISALFAPLVFLGNFPMALLGMTLWGIGMGAQESILKAAIAGMVPIDRRGSAFGIFHTGYGVAWFLGSALMGIFYDFDINFVILFSISMQLAAIPVLLVVSKKVANG
jgi:predicted MFS family arabinose efflux permease